MIMLKILLADADRIFLELGKTFLRKTGVEVFTCMNGEEVLSIMRKERPDLVILSTHMQISTGLECLRKIKRDESLKSIPVVVVSSTGKEEELEKCRIAGADDLLVKPVSRHTFMQTVNNLISLEKRINSRFETYIPVSYGFESPESFTSHAINLGTGGQFVEATTAFPVDTELEVKFMLPNTDVCIQCKARVAWVNRLGALVKPALPPGMGLKFLDLTQKDITAIQEYLRKELITPLL
jgi:uncharacterized protein (TIGR02266 family)